eukprot:15484156-Alexandrium_andersonii.AAC.1
MVTPASDGNDAAMQMLMDGSADAMWLYADQARGKTAQPLAPASVCGRATFLLFGSFHRSGAAEGRAMPTPPAMPPV